MTERASAASASFLTTCMSSMPQADPNSVFPGRQSRLVAPDARFNFPPAPPEAHRHRFAGLHEEENKMRKEERRMKDHLSGSHLSHRNHHDEFRAARSMDSSSPASSPFGPPALAAFVPSTAPNAGRGQPPNSLPPPANMRNTPRQSYLQLLQQPSQTLSSAPPKSRLLVLDVDNTILVRLDHLGNVTPRPYLRSFIRYIVHPVSPYLLALWTFSGRAITVGRVHALGLADLLLEDNNPLEPLLKYGVVALWGYEDSGISKLQLASGVRVQLTVKDLNQMWKMVNAGKPKNAPEVGPLNSLLVDDRVQNADAQPESIICAPKFFVTTDTSGTTDDFLLQLCGALDELAPETNFAAALQARDWRDGIKNDDMDKYAERGRRLLAKMGIKISRGKKALLQPVSPAIRDATAAAGIPFTSAVPIDDVEPAPTDRKGRVHVESLLGCCQNPPHPLAVVESGPKTEALSAALLPNTIYEKILAQPSKVLAGPKSPLIVLGLDGTIYSRPPCHMEPLGEPVARPYLLTFLTWLLRPSSPWTVAIWTSSPKETAVRCLQQLDLGLVGPQLVGPNHDQAEILHPKVVALWAREDLGLSPEEFHAYVGVTQDCDMLWEHLHDLKLGEWSAYDTVVVDDSPTKLRGQPDSLVLSPEFDYPLEPSPQTSQILLDTFLLQLVGALDELQLESNFANYIFQNGWAKGFGTHAQDLQKSGVRVLKNDKINIMAEARGEVMVPYHERRLHFKIGTTVVAPPALKTSHPSVGLPDEQVPHLNAEPTRTSNPLPSDSAFRAPPPSTTSRPALGLPSDRVPHLNSEPTRESKPSASDYTFGGPYSKETDTGPNLPRYHPDVSRLDPGGDSTLPPPRKPATSPRPPPVVLTSQRPSAPSRRPPINTGAFLPRTESRPSRFEDSRAGNTPPSPSSDGERLDSRFVLEEAGLAQAKGRGWDVKWKMVSSREQLVQAVEEWEKDPPSRDVPLEQSEPYQYGRRAYTSSY